MPELNAELRVIGEMPPYYEVAHALWGKDCGFDSDGDSYDPESKKWTELTLIKRPGYDERIDIDPIDGSNGLLRLRATTENALEKVCEFLSNAGSVERIDV